MAKPEESSGSVRRVEVWTGVTDSEAKGLSVQLCQKLILRLWAAHTALLSLSFLICNMGMKSLCLPHRALAKINGPRFRKN